MSREVAPSSDGAAASEGATWLFGLFAALLALSLILEQLWWNGFEVRSPHFAVILATLWVLVRPTSVVRFLTMLALEVIAVSLDMPEVGSHTLLVLITGVFLLTYVVCTTVRTGKLPDPGALFERVAPFLGLALLVVYGAAAVAKMNSSFFDPAVSCAADMSRRVAWFHPSLLDGAWRTLPSIWGTALIEVTLPLLLAVRRTRMLGLGLGLAFHGILGLAGNVPFSALAFAFYVAFLPGDTRARLDALLVSRRPQAGGLRCPRRAGGRTAVIAAALGCWLAGSVFVPYESGTRPDPVSSGARLLVLAMAAAGVGLCLVLARERGWPSPHRSLRLGHPVFAIGVSLLVLNSLTPYLGLKTDSSFTMFSNLQTERGAWNHLFIPESVRVFSYQNHLVHVAGSNEPSLRATAENGTRLVLYEVERRLRSHPGSTAVTYAETASGRPTSSARPDRGAPWVTAALDRVFKFQTVPPPGRGGCSR